ncbi:hypothetical protein V1477_015165 [Vespula maculifrons]|uniref:Uncharacterized protein n=2 Tax=Vespula TaxID=7451 RepID=A0A834JHM6_VESVU|nr:hypothetical protein HZH66_010010 [Vespula vulgaris]
MKTRWRASAANISECDLVLIPPLYPLNLNNGDRANSSPVTINHSLFRDKERKPLRYRGNVESVLFSKRRYRALVEKEIGEEVLGFCLRRRVTVLVQTYYPQRS